MAKDRKYLSIDRWKEPGMAALDAGEATIPIHKDGVVIGLETIPVEDPNEAAYAAMVQEGVPPHEMGDKRLGQKSRLAMALRRIRQQREQALVDPKG